MIGQKVFMFLKLSSLHLSVSSNLTHFVCRYMSLKCLCAQVINTNDLKYKGEVPEVLETFILAH